MWGLGLATKVYLALGVTDLRKGFDWVIWLGARCAGAGALERPSGAIL
jgi:hypothetical protein